MNTNIIRYDLSNEPLEYANRILRGKSLSHLLREKFDFSQGEFHTYLPSNLEFEEVLKFDRGGKFGKSFVDGEDKVRDASALVIAEIKEFLGNDENSLFIVEDLLPTAQDSWFQNRKDDPNIFVYKDELYHYLRNPDLLEEEFKDFLWLVESWCFVGVLTSTDLNVSIPPQGVGRLDEQEFLKIVNGTKKVVLGAYDYDSFLFWQPAN